MYGEEDRVYKDELLNEQEDKMWWEKEDNHESPHNKEEYMPLYDLPFKP